MAIVPAPKPATAWSIDASPNKAGYWMLGGRVGTAVVDEVVVPAFVSLLAVALVEFEEDMVCKIAWSRGD